MVIVPMRRHDQFNFLFRINSDALQIPKTRWSSTALDEGIDDNPSAVSSMQRKALAVTGPKDREFEFRVSRRVSRLRHGLNAVASFFAHSLPRCKSLSVIRGKSRKTICDIRLRVPSGERSYPITQRKMLPILILSAS